MGARRATARRRRLRRPAQYNPTAITVATNGDVYVADGHGQSWIHRYDRTPSNLQSWGGKGKELGKLDTPHGLAIDTRHGEPRLLVADRANIGLQYFSLDGEPLSAVSGNFATRQACACAAPTRWCRIYWDA